jgi:predicted peptidase
VTSRLFFALLIFIFFVSARSSTKKQFGQVLVRDSADTTRSKQEISRIRTLDNNRFEGASFGKGPIEIKYRLFKPKQQSSATVKYPLVVVYHSSGRPVGTDNQAQLGILPKLFASPDIQKSYPAYVLAPQFSTRSSDYVMDATRGVLCSKARPCLQSALQLIDSLKSILPIDSERIYVVGFSMGASTVLNSLSARPDLFAAGISIAGIPQFDKIHQLI